MISECRHNDGGLFKTALGVLFDFSGLTHSVGARAKEKSIRIKCR